MKQLPISLAMVIHNSELFLSRALENVSGVVDDIVIVHDGPCSDKSLQIAESFNARIFEREFMGSPEPHRPFSIAQCKNDWVLLLDDDEYLSPELIAKLPDLINTDGTGYDIAWFDKVKGKLQFTLYKQALFRKSQVFFIGAPVEYARPIDGAPPFIKIPEALINDPGDAKSNYNGLSFFIKKYWKFAKIQAKYYRKPFNELKNWNYNAPVWERNTRLKIQHPIILGAIGMTAKYCLELIRILFHTSPEHPQTIIRLILHNQMLYVYLAYLQLTKRT